MRVFCFLLCLSFFSGYSQGSSLASLEANQFSVNILFPSVEYERALSDKVSIDLLAGFALGYVDYTENSGFDVFPNFELQPRYYYNLKKRLSLGRPVADNSGDYVSLYSNLLLGEPIFGNFDRYFSYAVFVGPAWGFQRVYSNAFKLNINLGPGYVFYDDKDSHFSILIGVRLGWKIQR